MNNNVTRIEDLPELSDIENSFGKGGRGGEERGRPRPRHLLRAAVGEPAQGDAGGLRRHPRGSEIGRAHV